jgi:hypothetical protein
MRTAAKIICLLALAATLVWPTLFAFRITGEGSMKLTLLLAAVAWFAAAPFWLRGGEK